MLSGVYVSLLQTFPKSLFNTDEKKEYGDAPPFQFSIWSITADQNLAEE